LLFWRKGFAATSMNDLCDALSVRSPDLYAGFGSKGGAASRSRAQLQTIRPPVWGNFEGVTLAPAPKTFCLQGQKRSFERRP
jgi:AcrR family transcriptional regulator